MHVCMCNWTPRYAVAVNPAYTCTYTILLAANSFLPPSMHHTGCSYNYSSKCSTRVYCVLYVYLCVLCIVCVLVCIVYCMCTRVYCVLYVCSCVLCIVCVLVCIVYCMCTLVYCVLHVYSCVLCIVCVLVCIVYCMCIHVCCVLHVYSCVLCIVCVLMCIVYCMCTHVYCVLYVYSCVLCIVCVLVCTVYCMCTHVYCVLYVYCWGSWWDRLRAVGPSFGYHPNPSKTWLVVKADSEHRAEESFQHTGIMITSQGSRFLGAALGTRSFVEKFVCDKVAGWVTKVKNLSVMAKTHPQAAYAVFTHGQSSKWIFLMRTIPDIGALFQPLEDAIRQFFLPAITGRQAMSDTERELLTLPARLGGLGIPIPTMHPPSSDPQRG